MQNADTRPVVLFETGLVDALIRGAAVQAAVLLDLDLAVLERPHLGLLVTAGAVDLRAVPPVRLDIGERRRGLAVDDFVPVHRDGPADLHRVDREVITVAQWDVDDLVRFTIAVEEPVVVLELNPRGGDRVDDPGRLERVAGHQLAADQTRVRIEQLLGVGDGLVQRGVAAEARAGRAHPGIVEVVERPVRGAGLFGRIARLTEILVGPDVGRLEKIVLPEVIPQPGQFLDLQNQRRVLVPLPVTHDVSTLSQR